MNDDKGNNVQVGDVANVYFIKYMRPQYVGVVRAVSVLGEMGEHARIDNLDDPDRRFDHSAWAKSYEFEVIGSIPRDIGAD